MGAVWLQIMISLQHFKFRFIFNWSEMKISLLNCYSCSHFLRRSNILREMGCPYRYDYFYCTQWQSLWLVVVPYILHPGDHIIILPQIPSNPIALIKSNFLSTQSKVSCIFSSQALFSWCIICISFHTK